MSLLADEWLRPWGVFWRGELRLGVEVRLGDSVEFRDARLEPEPWLLTPAFVNAHSHFEYRGLLGRVAGEAYFDWIVELTGLKRGQRAEEAEADCRLAAFENRRTGYGCVAEHSDRRGAAVAMREYGLAGWLGQEVITLAEHADPAEKLAQIRATASAQSKLLGRRVGLSPHAPTTLDPCTLRALAAEEPTLSIHVAESSHENAFFEHSGGPWAAAWRRYGLALPTPGRRVVEYLAEQGCARPGVQFVHACDLEDSEIERVASAGVSVAHCPRSNLRLKCPLAPVRRLLEAGVEVGLGQDSAASSGPVDAFAEMRAALEVARLRDEPLRPEQVWQMAVLGWERRSAFWAGLPADLGFLAVEGPRATLDEVIERSGPEDVRWLT